MVDATRVPSSSVATASTPPFSKTAVGASASVFQDGERLSPLPEPSGPRKRIGKRAAVLILALIVIAGAIAIFGSFRKEPSPSLTPQDYRPGPIAPSPTSLESWVFHYAKGIRWSRVGGLQTVIIRISDVDPRWGNWQLNAYRADPLLGYSYDADSGWRNVQGVSEPPVGLPGPPKSMPKNVNHGNWTQITFAMKTTSGLQIKSENQATVGMLGIAR